MEWVVKSELESSQAIRDVVPKESISQNVIFCNEVIEKYFSC